MAEVPQFVLGKTSVAQPCPLAFLKQRFPGATFDSLEHRGEPEGHGSFAGLPRAPAVTLK